MKEAIEEVVDNLLEENRLARDTFRLMCDRGVSENEARRQIAAVLVGVLWESCHGLPNRLDGALEALRKGKSYKDIFPAEFYDDGKVLNPN